MGSFAYLVVRIHSAKFSNKVHVTTFYRGLIIRRKEGGYMQFDVKEKQSGTSVKGKPKISKKGNRHLRKAMHLPALVAIKHDQRYKAIYARIVAKHGIKMKALVAVQRRLLEMAYTIYKTNADYDKNHLKKDQTSEQDKDA